MTIQNPIYICGPTASGKTTLAIQLAKLTDGEIINADAYQLYSGLEILSAAPTAEELAQVPHHLYGTLTPNETCDAMRFRQMALPIIADTQARGKTPIITGGSGLYLKFLTHGPSPVPSSDATLRAQLENETDQALITRLTELDPEGAAATNLKNRRYLIRALEICILSGQKMSTLKSSWKKSRLSADKNIRGYYLLWDRETLRQRIKKRTNNMLEQGALREVASLTKTSATSEKAIGISQIRDHLTGNLTLEACAELITNATRQYAKRQRTWFRKESWLTPCPMDENTHPAQLAAELIKRI